MSDISTSTVTVDAPVDQVVAVLSDLPSYPSWSTSIKSVNVISKDDQGRATQVPGPLDRRASLSLAEPERDNAGEQARQGDH